MNIFKYKNKLPVLGDDVFIGEGAVIIGDCSIGDDVSIWFNTVVRGDVARISIGNCTNVQDNSTLHITDNIELTIGESVTVGHGAILHSCKIGDFSLIGMGSVVLDNVCIGDFSLVAAGSLLPPGKKYGSRKLIRGNPGREVRDLTDEEVESLRQSAIHYVNRKNEYLDSSVVEKLSK